MGQSEPEERRSAYMREYNAWIRENAFVRVENSSVVGISNIIGSHNIYYCKDEGIVKARIVPWGHRDSERHLLPTDSPCVNLEIFGLILSFAAVHVRILGQLDISTAFLDAKGFCISIHVKPQLQAADRSGLWKLLAAAYDLIDIGRLWYRISDHILVS